MADQVLQLTVRVDKDTGALEVVSTELQGVSDSAQKAGKSAEVAGAQTEELLATLGEFASLAAFEEFLRHAVTEASDYEQAVYRLDTQLKASNGYIASNTETAKEWADELSKLTGVTVNELLDGLGRAVQRTGDFTNAQRVVQLATGISAATHRDFATVLQSVAMAAGGSQRGLSMLQREFGAQLAGAKTATEALQILAQKYGDAAIKEDDLGRNTQRLWASLSELYRNIGELLVPSVRLLVSVLKDASDYWGELLGKDKTSGAKEMVQVMDEQIDRLQKWIDYEAERGLSADKVNKLFEQLAGLELVRDDYLAKAAQESEKKKQSYIVDTAEIEAARKQEQLNAARSETDKEIQLARKQRDDELSTKNQTTEQKRQIVLDAEADEQQMLDDALSKQYLTQEEYELRVRALKEDSSHKLKEIEQKNVTDSVAQMEKWKASKLDVDAQVQQSAEKVFDQINQKFGESIAKMIVEGKNFSTEWKAAMQQMAEAIIADLIRIEMEAFLVKNVLSGIGGFSIANFASAGGVAAGAGEVAAVAGGGTPAAGGAATLAGSGGVLLAGARTAPGSGDTGGQPVVIQGGINVHIKGMFDLTNAQDRMALMQAMAEEMKNPTSAAISFALRASQLSSKYPNRAA